MVEGHKKMVEEDREKDYQNYDSSFHHAPIPSEEPDNKSYQNANGDLNVSAYNRIVVDKNIP